MTDSEPGASAPLSDADSSLAAASPSLVICQHKLEGGVTTVDAPFGAHILDVQMIDGAFVLRTVEDTAENEQDPFKVLCVPLGGKVPCDLTVLTHIPTRAGGVHFFAVERGLSPS
jgi:hypothetical protein